jgi:hypothetical protein
MSQWVPVDGPYCVLVGVLDLVGRIYRLRWSTGWICAVIRWHRSGLAGRGIRFVKEVMVDTAVCTASR